jgi:hypothetical protein
LWFTTHYQVPKANFIKYEAESKTWRELNIVRLNIVL